MEPTPRPWIYSENVDLDEWLPVLSTVKDTGQGEVFSGEAPVILAFHRDHQPSWIDKQYLLTAVNNHDKLVEALRDAAFELDRTRYLRMGDGHRNSIKAVYQHCWDVLGKLGFKPGPLEHP